MENKEQERRINFSINEGEPFFAHEMSINFNPTQFILDFKCVTPRVDARTRDGNTVLSLKHNVVMVEPYHAKQILKVLNDMVGRYEKKFGQVKMPAPLAKLEKEAKKKSKTKKAGALKKGKDDDVGVAGKFPRYLG